MEQQWRQNNGSWILQRADPYVFRHSDGAYYFTASVPSYDRIILRKSDTLDGLATAEEVTIWKKHDNGVMSYHIWAPEIHYLDNKWYIYFAAGNSDNIWAIRPYVLECKGDDPINDTWIELGKLQRADEDEFSFEAFSLDATVFESKGKRYLVWAEKVGVGKMISNLYIAEMESPTKLKSQQILLSTPDYEWERVGFWVNEGPAVLKKHGKIYLTYSASATGACYCVGMLTADENSDLLDPTSWTKETNPVLRTDAVRSVYGPGHNSFTTTEDGKDVMIYHARPYEEIVGDPLYDPNRHARILEVRWDSNLHPRFEF